MSEQKNGHRRVGQVGPDGVEGGGHCRLGTSDMSQRPKAGAGAASSLSETEGGEKGEVAGLAWE